MMTHELEVSIVAAPLEAIDRRALSQAWYSALGFAASPRYDSIRPTSQRRRTMPPAASRAISASARAVTKPHLYLTRNLRAVRRDLYTPDTPLARQSQSRLAARIERAFAAASMPRRVTLSLGRGSARVHVVVQTTPTRTMLIALCRPELHADVRQALTQARMALAARGIALDLRKLGGRACS